jgi:hypothetical protein
MLRGKGSLGGGIGQLDRVTLFGGGSGVADLANVERLGDEMVEFEPPLRTACGVCNGALSDALDGREEVEEDNDD